MPRRVEHPGGPQLGVGDVDAHRGGDAAHGDPGTGEQGLQQHVTRAGIAAVPTGGRMQTGARRTRPRRSRAVTPSVLEGGLGCDRGVGGLRVFSVALLEGCLQGS